MYIKKILKKVLPIKSTKDLWASFKRNPDIIEIIERKIFQLTHVRTTLPPPSAQELIWINHLRQQVEKLPLELPTPSTSPAEKKWINFKNEFRQHILGDDPRNFLDWDVIRNTMAGTLNRRDFNMLSQLPFWAEWSKKIETLPLVNQQPYFKFLLTDDKTMTQLYNLAQLKIHTNAQVSDMDYIIEFGGGYGSMCAAIHALGFKGRYILFDWPEFLLLQEFYSKLHLIDISKVSFIHTLSELQKNTAQLGGKGLLIATWSLSEVSEKLRKTFLESIHPTHYLIAYQQSFGGINNQEYFNTFSREHPHINWTDIPINNIPGKGNRFLLGTIRHP
jgi:hypothetical protein